MRALNAGLPTPAFLRFNSARAACMASAARAAAFGVVLLRNRKAEQRHQPVALLPGDASAHLGYRRRGGVEISVHEVTPFLGIEP